MNKQSKALVLLLTLILLAGAGILVAEEGSITAINPVSGSYETELEPGQYSTIRDKDGKVLDKLSRQVFVGDEIITQDNSHYRVEKVDGLAATAVFLGREDIAWDNTAEMEGRPAVAGIGDSDTIPVQSQEPQNNLIAVYHTHSDESYIPTDGTESEAGEGGIFKVGSVFSEKLRSLGVEVIHDLRSHEPHDSSAYLRSRRTATKLLSKDPAAIVDVHRDGVPDPDFYTHEVSDVPVSNIRLVVGRQNQNMQANYDFAKRLKGFMDQQYPGLVKGIFLAKGNYNQDLSPRSILIEAGTHTISRERAEKGIALFAEALPPVLGITAAPAPDGAGKTAVGTGGDTASALFVIVALVLGTFIYLVISTGSIEGAVNKLREFITVEWANFFGKRKTKE